MSLIRGDALTIPLADNTVDLIVTSPPYFALRSYTDACGTCGGHAAGPVTGPSASSTLAGNGHVGGGPKSKLLGVGTADPDCPECEGSGRGHYAGQLGSEATPAAFIDALIGVTRECVRVLKPLGSCFVNLGDKYAEKGLMGLPWRYALACIDQLGLILRAEIIWSKPNGLPESVLDRVRRSHEQWFHFTLEPRYYSAVDEIREPHAEKTLTHRGGGQSWGYEDCPDNNWGDAKVRRPDPLGKPGSVWTIPTEPLRVPDDLPQHFAAFPSEWPRRIILGWSPSGICTECGQGRRPVVGKSYRPNPKGGHVTYRAADDHEAGRREGTKESLLLTATITGESCACPTPNAPTRPAVVLDPFAGTGTTVAVANTLGRFGVGVDLSADYLKLARWRCEDPGLRAKVLGVDKPAPEVPGQMALL